jgi:hypothetical protein
MTYDYLKDRHSQQIASRQYLQILHLAAMESETRVEAILMELLDTAEPITHTTVKNKICSGQTFYSAKDVHILKVDLIAYDDLLEQNIKGVANG